VRYRRPRQGRIKGATGRLVGECGLGWLHWAVRGRLRVHAFLEEADCVRLRMVSPLSIVL